MPRRELSDPRHVDRGKVPQKQSTDCCNEREVKLLKNELTEVKCLTNWGVN